MALFSKNKIEEVDLIVDITTTTGLLDHVYCYNNQFCPFD